jgi:hypothetical protein
MTGKKPAPVTMLDVSHARIRKAINDELAPYGLTFDSPRETWPENTIVHASERMKREHPPVH